jgi:hypothetical protein
VDAHHARVAIGDLLAIEVSGKGFHIFNILELRVRAHFFSLLQAKRGFARSMMVGTNFYWYYSNKFWGPLN